MLWLKLNHFSKGGTWPSSCLHLNVCVCVSVCVNNEFVRAITRHPSNIEPLSLEKRCKTVVKIPKFWGLCRRPPQMWYIHHQMGTNKSGFGFNQTDKWFNPNELSFDFCFQQRFVWVLTDLRSSWYTYICFDPNHRMEWVVSIQMLLGQQVLDMTYVRHYYLYGQLLSIMEVLNPEEACCYARLASVIISSNTGLKCWPSRGTTPSGHIQPSSPSWPILRHLLHYWMFLSWKTC